MDFLNIFINTLFLPFYVFIVLTVHEYGHYITARLFNIRVDKFSIGYGKEIWSKTDRHGTHWALHMYPVCGHTHLATGKSDGPEKLFQDVPLWQRLITVIAGPAVNIVLAFFLILLFFAFCGQPSRMPVIAGVEPGLPADMAGMQTGDLITAVNSQPVTRFKQVWEFVSPGAGVPLEIATRRGEERITITLTPKLVKYTTTEGLQKSHGIMGVLIGRNFLNFEALKEFNGMDVKDDEDKARELVFSHLGQNVLITLKTGDGKAHDYMTFLDPVLNEHLSDPDDDDYDSFYAGPVKDNFYLPLSATQSLKTAWRQTGEMIANIAALPFQLFPLDKEKIGPAVLVYDEDRYALRKFYEFTYRMALFSIIIALINLVPFPGFDGNMLLRITTEHLFGPGSARAHKVYKYLLLGSLSALYGLIFFANARDVPVYMEKKVENVSEKLAEKDKK